MTKRECQIFAQAMERGMLKGVLRERRRIRRILDPLVTELHALCIDFDARKLDIVKHKAYLVTRAKKGKGQ